MKRITITIDGPAGSGKGTTAKGVAEKLGYSYLDTGALYRMVTLYLAENDIDASDHETIRKKFDDISMYFDSSGKCFLNEVDVTDEIRTPEINKRVSAEAVGNQDIRSFVTKQSQQIVSEGGYVLDGRDAGAVIAPFAELKIYLECEPWERARRRALEFHQVRKEEIQKVLDEIIIPRDNVDKINIDKSREDGICVDTTNLNIINQIEKVYRLALERINN